MSSLNTNASAMTALQTLTTISKNMATTQSRISTGFRVNDASDNAAYWSIATTMRSDNKALSTVQDALGLGASKLDTAYTGMNKIIETVNELKTKIVSAIGATEADQGKIDTEIKELQAQMKAYADAATFSGTNMLSVDSSAETVPGAAADVKVVSAFNRNASGAASVSTIDISVQSIKLYDAGMTDGLDAGILEADRLGSDGSRTATAQAATAGDDAAAGDSYAVSTLTVTGYSDSQLGDMLRVVDAALKEMTDAATTLGATKNRINLQKEFTQNLMDSIDRGVGQLVDADMNKESARLAALQTQQQLGIQALSIANSNSQNILGLFR
ncbi:MAG: flagellin [Rhizobiaceae bacterium]|nr:flagellin [Rhizobiaceae bacterium]MCV0407014.1 flagellin [Rhizobiaceae bacterium]